MGSFRVWTRLATEAARLDVQGRGGDVIKMPELMPLGSSRLLQKERRSGDIDCDMPTCFNLRSRVGSDSTYFFY
jgi:hypothetical protein